MGWRLGCPWPLQKLVLVFLVKRRFEPFVGVISEQNLVHTERGAEGLLALAKVAVWVVVREPPS